MSRTVSLCLHNPFEPYSNKPLIRSRPWRNYLIIGGREHEADEDELCM